jgi:hypothetical protein
MWANPAALPYKKLQRMEMAERLRPGHLVCYFVVGGVMHALRNLGKGALQDQNSEIPFFPNSSQLTLITALI